jgi:hypothetical protein
MSNHYHLLVETPAANLSKGMQFLNGVYTQRFNRATKRSGHVFQGRFKAILVEKESHLLELARYVVLNPVRAKMVRSARDWVWSSCKATAGQAEVPGFLTIEWILSQFAETRASPMQAYRRFVSQGRGEVGVRRGSQYSDDASTATPAASCQSSVRTGATPRRASEGDRSCWTASGRGNVLDADEEGSVSRSSNGPCGGRVEEGGVSAAGT